MLDTRTLTCLINKDISSQEFSSLLQQILTTPVSTLLPALTSTETVKQGGNHIVNALQWQRKHDRHS